jgi:hypothetical protein
LIDSAGVGSASGLDDFVDEVEQSPLAQFMQGTQQLPLSTTYVGL